MVALCAIGLTATSCSDFLEAENKSAGGQEADGRFSADASSYLVSTYEAFKDLVTQINMNEDGTDLYYNTRGHDGSNFSYYTVTPETGDVKTYYQNAYKAINYANGVISYVSADSKEAYQARFLRDYGYYLLTQQFGGVPYITEYINTAERNFPRASLDSVYTETIKDLTDLYNNSTLDAQNHEGYANKQAVAALLAKLYLAAGWDVQTTANDVANGIYTVNSTEYFTQAAAWAEKAINGVQLTQTFEQKWSPTNEGNAEEIWSIQYDRASYPGDVSGGGHSLQNDYGGYFGNVTEFGTKYTGSDHQPTAKAIKLFSKGDTRYAATFMTTYYNASTGGWGDDGYFAYYNLDAKKLETQPIMYLFYPWYTTESEMKADIAAHKSQLAKYDGRVRDPQAVLINDDNVIVYSIKDDGSAGTKKTQTYDAYMEEVCSFGSVKKFDDPESGAYTKSNDYRDIVVFHVSDMYLVAAEAYLMAGQTSQALTKLNAVRNRAGLSSLSSFGAYQPQYSTSSSFTIRDIDVILDERARELYAERTRWVDLRRTKQLVRYNVEFGHYINSASEMANAKGEYKLLRPIPATELSSNTGMTSADQNPGY